MAVLSVLQWTVNAIGQGGSPAFYLLKRTLANTDEIVSAVDEELGRQRMGSLERPAAR